MKKIFAVLVVAVLLTATVLSVSAADATNIAAGKPYTISDQFRQSMETWGWDDNAEIVYKDDGKIATDGDFGSTDYHDEKWIGFHGGTPQYMNELHYSYIRIDLGAVSDISELKLYVGTSALGDGISIPTSVQFFVSDDGKEFKEVSEEIAPTDSTENAYTAVTATVETSGRYVEARIKRDGNWMFVTEFEVYGVAGEGAEVTPPAESKPADDKNPDTGDSTMVFALIALVAVAGAVVVAKKRAR